MPVSLQLQVWFCFGPFIAALLLVPTVVGSRPALLNGVPALYLSDTSRAAVCNERPASVSHSSKQASEIVEISESTAIAETPSPISPVALVAVSPISPRAP